MTTLSELVEAASNGLARGFAKAEASLDEVYADRNLLAIAYATEVERGDDYGTGGYYYHDDEEYPVVWAQTIHDQQSWHVHPEFEDLLVDSPLEESEPTGGYDGHSRDEKRQRLVRQVAAGGANRL